MPGSPTTASYKVLNAVPWPVILVCLAWAPSNEYHVKVSSSRGSIASARTLWYRQRSRLTD